MHQATLKSGARRTASPRPEKLHTTHFVGGLVQHSPSRCHVWRHRAEAVSAEKTTPGAQLLDWLQTHGAGQQALKVATLDLPAAGRPLDLAVAAKQLQPGDIALSIPETLVVTLDRVLGDETVAELLTTDKLSELAVLTLYLMYEKKSGKNSFWYSYIKELDWQRARGPQAVESPLLWDTDELNDLLKGSPVVGEVAKRLAGIEREWAELDTVWFMAGSLFNRYPFDVPSEAFSFNLFKQAFAAVQSSVVHLQGVSLAKRFALVPLGPPVLPYNSTCKAMLSFNRDRRTVELVVDRAYEEGQPVYAWCGPQPNSRLLINYGIVDENNPYDKLQMTASIPTSDPLYMAKRQCLNAAGLSTQPTFELKRSAPMPATLLPFMRLAYANNQDMVSKVTFGEGAGPVDERVEQVALSQLEGYFEQRLANYKQPMWRDMEVIADPDATPRQKICARLTKIEKSILQESLELVRKHAGGMELGGLPTSAFTVKLT